MFIKAHEYLTGNEVIVNADSVKLQIPEGYEVLEIKEVKDDE